MQDNRTNITARAIRNDKKHGLGFEEICQKYGCTSEELEATIRRYFFGGATQLLADLREVDRKREKRAKREQRRLAKGNESAPLPADDANTATLDTKTVGTNDLLADLRDRERAISDAVMQLESEHKALAGKHRSFLNRLRGLYQEIADLKKAFTEKASAYEKLVEESNQLVGSMNDISQRRREQLDILEGIRAEIRAKEVITIFAYTNGTIEAQTTNGFALDDSGSDGLYSELIGRDDFQDLRVRDIRVIARMVAITRNSGRTIQPCFEDEQLETYYHALLAA